MAGYYHHADVLCNTDLGDVHTSKDGSCLTDTGQALSQELRRQVIEVQVDVVPLWAAPPPLPDLHGH